MGASQNPPADRREKSRAESLRLRSAAVSLTADDIHKSIEWYTRVLGFFVGEKYERDGHLQGVELRAGSVTLYLSQDDWQKGRDRKKGEGCRIYLTTVQDVDALAARATSAGARLDQEPTDMPWGSRDFAISDPDGFRITVSQDRTN
jgi:uncharacterized glyoxalase superfamily protein PhnB